MSLKEARARRLSRRALSLVRGQSLYNRLARSTRAGGVEEEEEGRREEREGGEGKEEYTVKKQNLTQGVRKKCIYSPQEMSR